MPTCETCNIVANGMGWSSHLTAHRSRGDRIIVVRANGVWEYDFSKYKTPATPEVSK